MGRKFTVYGLRFSKTSFWNRINTGFLDPAVATVLTACGIETWIIFRMFTTNATWLQQCLPLAVLKRIENCYLMLSSVIQLQQCLPLAVLKLKGGIMST